MEPGTTINTWQQAFQDHRIPTTRAIEKQLRAGVSRDKEKLRALVGGSYRELLATAEAIVVLQEKTKVTEDHLSSISHNCRPPQHEASAKSSPPEKVALAQLRLLQRCHTTSSTSLRNRNLLQCSKLLFLSRLLLKSLDNQESLSESLEYLRNKFGVLRRQLLRQIDATLVNPVSNVPDLLEGICSYCLVTSVSTEDALTHLRQLRLEKLRRQLDKPHGPETICEGLQYQLASLQTFKALNGRPIIEAMNNLRKKPILEDPAINTIESLDLDRLWPLLPEEIRTFVPYFKRSAPSAEEMQAKLEAWSREACQLLSNSVDDHLSKLDDITGVLELRKDIYEILLPVYFSTPASNDINKHIRHSLNQRISQICHSQGDRLSQVTQALIESAVGNASTKSLWDAEIVQTSLERGASKMIARVKSRHSGLNARLSKSSRTLNAWISTLHATQKVIDELPKVRWRDAIEEPDDEQEEEAAHVIRMLCKEDPSVYSESLEGALQKALSKYETSLASAASAIGGDCPDISKAVYLLRSIRVSVSALQHAFPEGASVKGLEGIVPRLHQILAADVMRRLSEMTERDGTVRKWDKSQLPENMPSPKAFMTLRRLCNIVTEIGGTDSWCTPALTLVKKDVGARVFMPEHRQDYMEHEFDEAYLRIALDQEDGSAVEMKRKSPVEFDYWLRTKLLFGVLST
ncbi:hypothetical protein EDD37DRAFT_566157 [Exophiala viscosa]|uniref:Conserved oligomeric Golgi complex subunit 1 n=1 Tax=Exophiala viscosa TaxID=2486360 RepID=A0AAN6ICD2_9EURO|nr:hypothetical protein EDD36DRAFT_465726 [Exophiala viscosa]KAI1623265.1 hypothetical protein EDD37DRAFT_566157 [Exophiala viscosa]